MGLFDRPQVVPLAPEEPKYTIEKIQERLDVFGLQRLNVRDAVLKVLISKVTWGALSYLNRISGGKPNGGHIAEMMAKLDLLNKVLDQYVKIQNGPSDNASKGTTADLLADGSRAVAAYYAEMSKDTSSSQDLFDYKATTDFLSGNIASI
ncbi:MAG TPA: hypothetical protein VIM31_01825 [Candidatus Microsaccharimonas sp.]